MATRKSSKATAANPETPSAWVHPFERDGLGKAPFQVVGYEKSMYQAIPGDPDCPIQPGSSCDFCGTAIMHVFHIQGADEKAFKVGCDCVARTGDTDLLSAARRAERAWLRQTREAGWKKERDERARREAERRAIIAERNADALAMIIEGAAIVAASQNISAYERSMAAGVHRDLTEGHREGISEREWEVLQVGYRAALCPKSAHVGLAGERLRNLVVQYEGGPAFDTAFGMKVINKFRVLEGPLAGAVLVWKTSYRPADRGEVVKLTGTVDRDAPHDEYDGVLQTRLGRCIVADVDA